MTKEKLKLPFNCEPWESEKIIFSYDEWLNDLVIDISNASISILVEMYIFSFSEVGIKILDELKKASSRGVRVKLLLDGFGSYESIQKIVKYCEKTKVKIKLYHPLPGSWSDKNRSSSSIWDILKWTNRRNHKKVIIIDNKTSYIGSANVGDQFKDWQEIVCRLEGEGVRELRSAFLLNWNFSNVYQIKKQIALEFNKRWNYKYLELNHTLKLRRKRLKDFYERISNAKTDITIFTPYIVLSGSFFKSLKLARSNNVEVQLVFSQKSDSWFMQAVAEVFLEVLFKMDVKIFIYSEKFIHAKLMIVDDWIRLGSTNLNFRSLFLDLEADVVLSQDNSKNDIYKFVDKIKGKSEIYNSSHFGISNFFKRLIGKLFLVFRRWL